MIYSVIIFILTCISLVVCIIKKPTITIKNHQIDLFFIITLIGSLFILIPQSIPIDYVIQNIFNDSVINPIKILILLLSMTFLSITLDELGFFNYIAYKSIKAVNGSQYKLFFMLYIVIAILTIFTSNDIVVLTFTLFICYFSKKANINPIPFLIMEFITANTYSMIFIIGNPTNIYLATTNNIGFFDYFKIMVIPTLFAGISSLIAILFLFRKELNKPFSNDIILEESKLNNKALTIISLIHLFLCTIILAISSYINLEMWIISLLFAFSLLIFTTIYSIKKKENIIIKVCKRLPYNLVIFVISMFIIVLSLSYHGVINEIYKLFSSLSTNKLTTILTYGISSTLSDNLINNIPMSLGYSSILSNVNNYQNPAIFATIIGSNIGAFLTPIGALAGIMWMSILKNQNIKFNFIDFTKYGIILTPIILLFALIGLYIVI